jgi:hypothetical protein
MEGAAMLIMYRGFALVPVKDGEMCEAQVFSGGRPMAATPPRDSEVQAMSEAKKLVDGLCHARRSA